MNNFLKVFNDELKNVQGSNQHERHTDDNFLKAIEKDIGNIPGHFGPVIEAVREKYDAAAEIKYTGEYKTGDEITVIYKNSTLISYQLQKGRVSSDVPASYRIKVSGKLQLPDILAQTNDNGHYYYFEDKYTSSEDRDKDDLVGIPYQDSDGVVETNQFERVLEKHIARLAGYIGADTV